MMAAPGNSTTGSAEFESDRYATPLVRQLAERYAVNLAALQGTGVGGRVTAADVRKAADGGLGRRLEVLESNLTRATASASSTRRPEPARSSFTGAEITLSAWARNPLIDDARQSLPHIYNAVVKHSSAPTLFASGDLPAFVASGADPGLLLLLPWQARHVAANADASEFARILEDYTNDDLAAAMNLGGHPANDAYMRRVQDWLRNGDDPNYVG